MLGVGNLTPTQLAAHERSRAFKAKIAEMAARLTTNLETLTIEPAITEPVIEERPKEELKKPWFSMVPEAGDPLPSRETPSLLQIQQAVCRYYNLRRADLISHRRTWNLAIPRQIAAFISKDLTATSLPLLGKHMGGRDHTTMLYAIRKIGKLLLIHPEIAFDVAAITHSIVGDRPQ